MERLRRLGELPEVLAIQRTLPWSFVGLAVGLAAFMLARPSGTFLERLYASFAPAFGVMSFVLVVLLSIDLARRRKVSWLLALVTAGTAFALALPYRQAHSAAEFLRLIGSSGLFLAMIASIVSVWALREGENLAGKAGALAGAVVVIGASLGAMLAGFSLAGALAQVLAPLANLGDSLTALVILTLVETILWVVGIHGPALLAPIVLPVYMGLQAQNTEALAHHAPLPHIVTVSLFLFVFPGGAGATFPLVLLLLRSRIRRARTVALTALGPAIFNANEPLMFGLPIVFDPALAVPYVLTPAVLAIVSYTAIAHGLVSRPALYIPSPVPIFANVFLATKDWRACVLVLVNIAIGLAIYAPFIPGYERRESAKAPAS